MFTVYTDSDAGSVLVGNNDMEVMVPNGYGDGTTKVTVLDSSERELIPKEAQWACFSFIGHGLHIYKYDCSRGTIAADLPTGHYFPYYLGKQVWLLRSSEEMLTDRI